ncbi:MAG: GNAT family N-acetyltransferase [Dehalococcoidia bacterium]|nr:GNAT family N-acetyltransferase [Dehalococcoidia bacterium]
MKGENGGASDRGGPVFRIRAARPGDREEVLRFSRNTWEWGDYLHLVWDRWFHEPEGKLLVGAVGKRPVAAGHVVIAAPGEAWLEGLRVNPAYRLSGVATRMTQRCIEEARKMGAKVARFATVATNEPVHRVADRLGFGRVASYQPLEADGLPGSADASRPSADSLSAVLAFLAGSPALSATNGLYSTGWRFHRLTVSKVKDCLEKGMVRMVKGSAPIAALSILEPGYDGQGLAVSYADGEHDRLVELAAALRYEALSGASHRISARLPEHTAAHDAFVKAGFTVLDPGPFWIYELSLKPGPSSSET